MVNAVGGGVAGLFGEDKKRQGAPVRMLEGMDNRGPTPPHGAEPLLYPGPPKPAYDQATRDKYVAQRAMRGLADLVFGLPDMANLAINAGIRNVDYYTGGGLSAGSYDPYQLPMASQSWANGIAEMSGADIVPPEAVSPTTRRWGEYVQLGAGILPIGVGGIAVATGKSMKTLASRSTNIYPPPSKPARPFELDYPNEAPGGCRRRAQAYCCRQCWHPQGQQDHEGRHFGR